MGRLFRGKNRENPDGPRASRAEAKPSSRGGASRGCSRGELRGQRLIEVLRAGLEGGGEIPILNANGMGPEGGGESPGQGGARRGGGAGGG